MAVTRLPNVNLAHVEKLQLQEAQLQARLGGVTPLNPAELRRFNVPPGLLDTAGPAGGKAPFDAVQLHPRTHLEQVLSQDPTAVRPRVLLFLYDLAEGNVRQAESRITALLQEQPNEAEYLALYAELKLRTAELPHARELSAKASRIAPEHPDAERLKVLLEVLSGEREPTDPRVARVFEHEPQARQVYVALFHTLVERHQLDEALRLGQAVQHHGLSDEAFATALIDVRLLVHPFGLPTYALRRAGWLGTSVVWFVGLMIYVFLLRLSETLAHAFAVVGLCFLAWAWLYPGIMRRWLSEN